MNAILLPVDIKHPKTVDMPLNQSIKISLSGF